MISSLVSRNLVTNNMVFAHDSGVQWAGTEEGEQFALDRSRCKLKVKQRCECYIVRNVHIASTI